MGTSCSWTIDIVRWRSQLVLSFQKNSLLFSGFLLLFLFESSCDEFQAFWNNESSWSPVFFVLGRHPHLMTLNMSLKKSLQKGQWTPLSLLFSLGGFQLKAFGVQMAKTKQFNFINNSALSYLRKTRVFCFNEFHFATSPLHGRFWRNLWFGSEGTLHLFLKKLVHFHFPLN